MKKIAVIDYDMSNLFSVKNAFLKVGKDVTITNDPEFVMKADGIVLPGVGSFGRAMDSLKELNLIEIIKNKIKNKIPFFGICLGMHLLLDRSEEFGENLGLGIIKGDVKKISDFDTVIKVPHVGWNKIISVEKLMWEKSPLSNVNNEEFMYFVHSYCVKPTEHDIILSKTVYEKVEFCSSILKENIFATQFHPEKSGEIGLEIYRNWLIKNDLR
ncbi:MAG: imidazole glycerol phosphate synthase subunit HisH [Candidatus Muiribacterium halophilum]|uniref:Imidazole glycerol phosphate synthase subunit HisH n=1 Tax=Muiribacterium halophilum TaxID=2053465 RepID=A0A2N5ZA68_MUIH1|nr:MAG: imidazole glycerol phosphate synthase subunit HisH [Candidatus Muirbacterium halophilum]